MPSVLDLERKTAALVAKIDAGEIVVPLTKDGRRAAMDELSRVIGLNRRNQIPNRLWQPVLDAARRQHPRMCNHDLKEAKSGVGFESIRSALQTWELMWTYREWLSHDRLCFQPIAYPQSVESIAISITPRVKNTRPVPPAYETCRLINEALALFLEQKSSVIEFHRGLKTQLMPIGEKSEAAYQRRRAVLEGLIGGSDPDGAVVRYLGANVLGRDASTGDLIYQARRFFALLLPGAGATILSAFMARRPTETLSIRMQDLRGESAERAEVACWISKTSFDEELIPVPQSVVEVFRLMRDLKEEARAGDDWLFDIENPVHGGSLSIKNLTPAIREFAEMVGVLKAQDGSPIDWCAYAFRHFFGLVYYYRFHFPSLRALSHFLRHVDLDATRYYIHTRVQGERLQYQDEERAKSQESNAAILHRDFETVRTNFIINTAKEALQDPSSLGGHGGRAWRRELAELAKLARAQSSVAIEEEGSVLFDNVLRQWASTKYLEPHPEAHSFCSCGPEKLDLSIAACLQDDAEAEGNPPWGPSLLNAADLTCAECPHNMQLRCNADEWQRRLAESEQAVLTAPDAATRAVAQMRAEEIGQHILRNFDSPETMREAKS